MTPTDIALLGGLALSAVTTVVMPRMRERAAGAKVSWQSMNDRLVEERDRSDAKLEKQAEEHRAEITAMRAQHATEIKEMRDRWETDAAEMRRALDVEASEMKQRYDEEMARLSSRLEQCQKTVNSLYRELYELQRLLPPGTPRPPVTP
ncbi:MAG TPA: hypothetical protein VFW64_12165 [Pseudonocardiaceae bacterium]|nr:hypothetical protein [Pseudonocardiaceae bacterium]